MSTTWVFVGLLCGRELAISTMNKEYKFKYVFPLIGKDFIKMVFGLSVSVGIVLAIVLIYFSILLFYIFYIHGGPIQKVVLNKTGTRDRKSVV